jgi:hypothetical protein
MDKQYANMIHSFEQGGAMLEHFAGLLGTYHNHLCSQGFNRDEALQLVIQLQTIIFSQAFNLGPKQGNEDE